MPALLALPTAAMLAGAQSLYAISQLGRLRPATVRQALGFLDSDGEGSAPMPAATTLHCVFKRLDVAACEREVQAWAAHALDTRTHQVVLDGKALRGIHGEDLPGVRLVAVYASDACLVLAQARGQDPRGAGTDRGGAGAGQAGG